MTEIRRPNITGKTSEEQLNQVKNYLYQLTNQLNYALKAVNGEKTDAYTLTINGGKASSQVKGKAEAKEKTAEEKFAEIKGLIIKSADIVNAYSDVIQKELVGKYEAYSDFGEFVEKTHSLLQATPESTIQAFSSIQTINGDVYVMTNDFYFKIGWLDSENTEGGIELGQRQTITESGETKKELRAIARFTSRKLSFYGSDFAEPIGWFSGGGLETNHIKIGDYMITSDNGLGFVKVGDL